MVRLINRPGGGSSTLFYSNLFMNGQYIKSFFGFC